MSRLLNIIVVASFLILFLCTPKVFAQGFGPIGIGNPVKISDTNVQDGSIVSASDKGFVLSSRPYDRAVVGIVALRPAINFGVNNPSADTYPLVTSGQTFVLVTGENGALKKGDLITTSGKKGIGMKATQTGYVLGYALEDFNPKNKSEVRKIAINIKIYLFATDPSIGSNILDIFKASSMAAAEEPIRVFRYALAAVIILGSILLGFLSFARMASHGIEALGRNPLATRAIQFGIIMNIILTIVIILSGIAVALFVVRL